MRSFHLLSLRRTGSLHLAARVSAALLLVASAAGAQGPFGEYGDAPESPNGQQVEAYPGVLARFPSFYRHTPAVVSPEHDAGTWVNPGATFWLGQAAPDLEDDSRQDPGARDNDASPVVLLEGLGPNPLASLLVTVGSAAGHDPDQELYLNVFLDQNRDGQWKDGLAVATPLSAWNLEWVVQDLPLKLQAGVETEIHVGGLRVEAPRDSHWLRMVLTDQPVGEMFRPHPQNGSTGFWDATMPLAHGARGEVEDFLLEFFADPRQMTRGGITLRTAYEQRNPGRPPGGPQKPECLLTLRKVVYTRPFGFIAPFMLLTPWCSPDPNGVDFGLAFKKIDVLGGCTLAPNALVGLYGPTFVSGVPVPPILSAAGNSPATVTTQACPVATGLALPSPHPRFGTPLWSPGHGSIPIPKITDPAAVGNLWHVCYPSPHRYRLYRSPVEARTCGCETQNYLVYPACDAPCDLSHLSDAGQPAAVDFFNGDLIENFVDAAQTGPRPFPDPDFPNPQKVLLEPEPFGIWRIASSLAKLGVPDHTPPSSLELNAARYVVRPAVPAGMRATRVSFWVLCEAFDAAISYKGGGGATIGPKTCSLSTWRQEALDIPAGSKLDSVTITMANGFLDELVVELEPEPTDCDGNGVADATEIQNGTGSDCDGDGVLDACQLADDDCNGNLTLDRCEIAAGTVPDVNQDGVPDACLPEAPGVCIAGPTALCLQAGRFRVEADWRTFTGASGAGQAVPLTSDTGYFWFFGPDNVETVVKVLDACTFPGDPHFWVFSAGLTNVEVGLTVTDTATGVQRHYTNPQGTPFAPIQDTGAFNTCGGQTTPAGRGLTLAASPLAAAPASLGSFRAGSCLPTPFGLCLQGGRFLVSAHFDTHQGLSGMAQAIPITADTGYFWFFQEDNVELIVKVLNACTFPGAPRFWVFGGGLTNVEVRLEVLDTVTGLVRTYTNPQGISFRPIQDIGAFATCP